ncbi:MAG: hypothetical protein MN733_20185, partial [Nitrososphaera sp.]|nr:hypothetical protein [Nitrososphaera sp.]
MWQMVVLLGFLNGSGQWETTGTWQEDFETQAKCWEMSSNMSQELVDNHEFKRDLMQSRLMEGSVLV